MKRVSILKVFAVLFLLYVLSYGPAMGLYYRIDAPVFVYQSVQTFYAPINWLVMNSEGGARLVNGYVEYWLPNAIACRP